MAPLDHGFHRAQEVGTALGEVVPHLHRSRRDDFAHDQFGDLQFAQALGQEPIGESGHQVRDLAEAMGVFSDCDEDSRAPTFANELDRRSEAFALVVIEVLDARVRSHLLIISGSVCH